MAEIASLLILVLSLAITVFIIAGLWKAFAKAGHPGIACIVPIWNLIVMVQMAGKPVWWFLLLCIPVIGIVFGIIIAIGIAENFGKTAGFGIGLAFLGFIFWPILGFGDAQYQGVQP
ncbi:MAG: DUF5684 domain-containing protein [Pirellulales bacterium]